MQINCIKGCCHLLTEKFTGRIDHKKDFKKFNKLKAGGIFHDKEQNKVLIVQSRGRMWGFPKGTKENYETIEQCAIREIKEETGIEISNDVLEKSIKINNGRSTFYYVEHPEIEVEVQNKIVNNDANGIGWINIECLQTLLNKNIIQMNRQSKIALKYTIPE